MTEALASQKAPLISERKSDSIKPKGKGKMRGSKKKRHCDLVYFLFIIAFLNIYYFLLLKIVIHCSCTISGASVDSQDSHDKVFAIGNYTVYILIMRNEPVVTNKQ